LSFNLGKRDNVIIFGSLLTYFEVDNNYSYGCASNDPIHQSIAQQRQDIEHYYFSISACQVPEIPAAATATS